MSAKLIDYFNKMPISAKVGRNPFRGNLTIVQDTGADDI